MTPTRHVRGDAIGVSSRLPKGLRDFEGYGSPLVRRLQLISYLSFVQGKQAQATASDSPSCLSAFLPSFLPSFFLPRSCLANGNSFF